MKIRTRIFSLVLIMGVVICAVGGIAVYSAVSFADKVQQLENASARAFAGGPGGERLGRAELLRSIGLARLPSAAPPMEDGP